MEALTDEEIKRLAVVMNQEGKPENVSLPLDSANALPSSAPQLVSDRIKLVKMTLSSVSFCTGILVYHSVADCALIGIYPSDKDIIELYRLDVRKRIATPIVEKLTADELRRVLDDTAESKGVAPELEDKLSFISVSNITAMSDAQLDGLKVGDVVQKITGDEKHCYTVTYKEEHHGICLSYFAAGYTETVSYDYVGGHWVYNSTDIVPIESGTKLYKHHLIIDGEAGFGYPITVDLITSTSTPLSKDTPINLKPGFDFVSGYLVDSMNSPSVLFSFPIFSNSRVSIFGISEESEQIILKTVTMTSLTDTVTEL